MGTLGDMVKRSSSDVVRLEDAEDKDLASAIRKRLHKGIVHFIYRKKPTKKAGVLTTGAIRDAWGTLNFEQIPAGVKMPSVAGHWQSNQWTYMDIESEGWRVAYELLGADNYIYTPEEYEKLTKDEKTDKFIRLAKKLDIWDEVRPTSEEDSTETV